MSSQLQMPQTQQPLVDYPNSESGQAAPTHPHSNGSFGTVFVVLAVIIIISGIACCLGRLCNRRISQSKPSKQNKNPKKKFRPDHKERDIEFGIDGKMPGVASKPAGYGDPSRGFKMPGNGNPNGLKMSRIEDPKGFRIPEQGESRRLRMPGNGNPAGIRMPGNGDFKVVDGGELKLGA